VKEKLAGIVFALEHLKKFLEGALQNISIDKFAIAFR
jgi:hypothetical protein